MHSMSPEPPSPAAGPSRSVAAGQLHEAIEAVEAEEERVARRTGRRLAIIAVAIAVVFTATFCGTGVVVTVERREEKQRWQDFVGFSSEYGCCEGGPLRDACLDAPRQIRKVALLARAHPTAADRLAARLEALMGISPVLIDVSLPALSEVEDAVARCATAARAR